VFLYVKTILPQNVVDTAVQFPRVCLEDFLEGHLKGYVKGGEQANWVDKN